MDRAPIVLRYAWTEADFDAYRQGNHRYREVFRPALAERFRRMAVSGFVYNLYHHGPAALTVCGLALWFAFFPEARPRNPLPTLLVAFVLVEASGYGVLSAYHRLAGNSPDAERIVFDALKDGAHEARLDAQGFVLVSQGSEARYSWQADALPVEIWGDHLLILHPLMVLVVPSRAADRPLAEVAAAIARWRAAS